jgi:hypothetical protein
MQNPNPTFIRLFGNDAGRGTEYLAISTITKVHVEVKELERGTATRLHIFTLEGAERTVTAADAQEIIDALDKLSPGGIAGTGEGDVATSKRAQRK